jgi:hypothetical protein
MIFKLAVSQRVHVFPDHRDIILADELIERNKVIGEVIIMSLPLIAALAADHPIGDPPGGAVARRQHVIADQVLHIRAMDPEAIRKNLFKNSLVMRGVCPQAIDNHLPLPIVVVGIFLPNLFHTSVV